MFSIRIVRVCKRTYLSPSYNFDQSYILLCYIICLFASTSFLPSQILENDPISETFYSTSPIAAAIYKMVSTRTSIVQLLVVLVVVILFLADCT